MDRQDTSFTTLYSLHASKMLSFINVLYLHHARRRRGNAITSRAHNELKNESAQANRAWKTATSLGCCCSMEPVAPIRGMRARDSALSSRPCRL